MKENTRSWLRTLSGITAGAGIILALGAAGTSDYRDALRDEDEETREKLKNNIISVQAEKRLAMVAFGTLALGTFGLLLTEKRSNQR